MYFEHCPPHRHCLQYSLSLSLCLCLSSGVGMVVTESGVPTIVLGLFATNFLAFLLSYLFCKVSLVKVGVCMCADYVQSLPCRSYSTRNHARWQRSSISYFSLHAGSLPSTSSSAVLQTGRFVSPLLLRTQLCCYGQVSFSGDPCRIS